MRLAILGAVLVLVGIGIGYYIAFIDTPQEQSENTQEEVTQEQEQTKQARDTNAYKNNTFSFDYNTDAFVTYEPDDETAAVVLFTKKDWETFRGEASGREAPPAITVEIFRNTNNLSALEWVEQNTRSNFGFGDQTYEGVSIDGELGVLYNWDGLYQGESVVVAHNGKIYMLSVTFLERSDPLVSEFASLLESFSFTQ